MLGASLSHLADLMEREAKLTATVQSALIYPALLVAASIGTVVLLLVYVVPQFTPILPRPARPCAPRREMLIGAGAFIQNYGVVAGGCPE